MLGGRYQVVEHIVQRETFNIVDLTKLGESMDKDDRAFLRTGRGDLLAFETVTDAERYALSKSPLYSEDDLSLVSDRAEERNLKTPGVYNYRSIPSDGMPSVILIGFNTDRNEAWYLADTAPGHPDHPKIDRFITSIKDFQTKFAEAADEDIKEVAKLIREHARYTGITGMALTELRRFLPINDQGFSDMGSKTAADAAPKTNAKGAKAKPEKIKPASTAAKTETKTPAATKPAKAEKAPAATKPATAPKADKAPAPAKEPKVARPSVSSRFCELIMEGKKTDDEIFAIVKKEFGLSDDKRSYVSWNRNNLLKKGKTPPPAVGGAAKPGPKAKK